MVSSDLMKDEDSPSVVSSHAARPSKLEVEVKTERRNSAPKLAEKSDSKWSLYACLASLTLTMFIMALDVLIVSTIIDEVSKELGDYKKTGWLVTGYSLPNCLLSLIWGRVASVFGFSMSLSSAIVIFEIGSLVAALANSMNMLIGGRVIAGIGGSGLQTLCFVIGCSLVPESSRPMIISALMSSFALASIAGPFIGGAFTTHVTWRWCFWINIPIGGLAIVVFILTYHPNNSNFFERFLCNVKKFGNYASSRRKIQLKEVPNILKHLWFKFDIGGLSSSCLGLVLLLLGLSFGGTSHPWRSGIVISFIVVGALLFFFSLLYEFAIYDMINSDPKDQSHRPLLCWKIVSKPAVYTANIFTFLISFSYNCQMIYSVQFFQLVFGSTAWSAGLHLIPIVISSVLSAVVSGGITKKTGHVKILMLFGSVAGVIGAGLLILLNNNANSHTKIGVLILPGVALGASLQAALIGSQICLDRQSSSFQSDFIEVTAFNGYMKSLGTTFGGILSTTVFGTSAHNMIKKQQVVGYTGLKIDEIVSTRLSHFDGPRTAIGNIMNFSVRNVFLMALGAAGWAFIFSVFTTNKRVQLPGKSSAKQSDDERAAETTKSKLDLPQVMEKD